MSNFREFLSRFRSRTSAATGLGGAVANPTSGFYSGLNSEVNAIEMEDLSKGRSGGNGNIDATSTKNTMISSCNTPTCLTSLTDLTKIGLDGTISAEAVRDRVQANTQDQTFDLKVCIHTIYILFIFTLLSETLFRSRICRYIISRILYLGLFYSPKNS